MTTTAGRLPETLTVRKLSDPNLEAHGFPVTSGYVETYWLPVVGPSGLWLLRRLADMATHAEEVGDGSYAIETTLLAKTLGLGPSLGADGALSRSFGRLAKYGGHVTINDGVVRARTHIGRVPPFLRHHWPQLYHAMHDIDFKEAARR